MTTKSKNKNIIIGICAAIIIVVLIILAIIFGTRNGGFGGLNDAFFTSDGSKYVITMDAEEMAFDNEEFKPIKSHIVYFYSGDAITGLKAYYEYSDNDAAKTAGNYFTDNLADQYKSIAVDGKYVVLEANESEYEGVTPDDVKQQIEFIESLNEMKAEENTTTDTNEVVEETVTTEE